MKTSQILLSLSLIVLFFISCKKEDDVVDVGSCGNLNTKTLTVITQEPFYNGYKAWGIVSADNGQTLGFGALNENQDHQIQYELPNDYEGEIHFNFYQFKAGQDQGIQLRTFSNISEETLYLKSDIGGVSSNYNRTIKINLDGSIAPEDILRVIIIPDKGSHTNWSKLDHSIRVDENESQFFIAVLLENNIWKYDYIEPEVDENNLKIFPNEFQNETENRLVDAENGSGWSFDFAGIVEENNMERRNYLLRSESRDTAFNQSYNIQGVSDISVPAILLAEYDNYYTYYSVGRPGNNPDGGYFKYVYGKPQLNFNPSEVDYTLAYSENNFMVEAMSDYSYSRTSWIKRGDENANQRTSWHWDVSGAVNQGLSFPLLPAELNDQIHQKIERVGEFDSYDSYVVNDSKFPNYQLLLEEILFQEENKNRMHFPFLPNEYSLDREIEVSHTSKKL